MISNTDLFYEKALSFQNERSRLRENYERALENLKKYRGSAGYAEETKKLKTKYEDDLSALQNKYRPEFRTILDGMENTIGKRPAKAPTGEQIRLLNALSLKKKSANRNLKRLLMHVLIILYV